MKTIFAVTLFAFIAIGCSDNRVGRFAPFGGGLINTETGEEWEHNERPTGEPYWHRVMPPVGGDKR